MHPDRSRRSLCQQRQRLVRLFRRHRRCTCPTPMLKVLYISRSEMSPVSCDQVEDLGAPRRRLCSMLADTPLGSAARDVLIEAAAGDVGNRACTWHFAQAARARALHRCCVGVSSVSPQASRPARRTVVRQIAFPRCRTPCAPAKSRWNAHRRRPGPMITSPGLHDFAGRGSCLCPPRPTREAGQVVFVLRVEAGHLGGLAAHQRAAGLHAALGHAGDDLPQRARARFCRRRCSRGRAAALRRSRRRR